MAGRQILRPLTGLALLGAVIALEAAGYRLDRWFGDAVLVAALLAVGVSTLWTLRGTEPPLVGLFCGLGLGMLFGDLNYEFLRWYRVDLAIGDQIHWPDFRNAYKSTDMIWGASGAIAGLSKTLWVQHVRKLLPA